MARKRIPLKQKTNSMISAPARVQQLAIFGPPLLLEGEDEVAYDELLARICAAVKPVNVIEEMFVADVVFLEWEILRLRRLKLSLLKASGHEALKDFLLRNLLYDLYVEALTDDLAKILQKYVQEDRAQELAQQCARWEPDAINAADLILNAAGRQVDDIRDAAKEYMARHLARLHARHEPKAIKQVNRVLAYYGLTLHDIMAKGLTAKIEEIERIDRLITIAEGRRTTSLREIDRHRAALGEAVRRNLQEVEDAEFEVVETAQMDGKSAA
jgi:hypothetical protein